MRGSAVEWNGILSRLDPQERPAEYILDEYLYQKLFASVSEREADNWYAWLHIGFYE